MQHHAPRVGQIVVVEDRPHIVKEVFVTESPVVVTPQEDGLVLSLRSIHISVVTKPDNATGYLLLAANRVQADRWAREHAVDPRRVHTGSRPDSLRGVRGPIRVVDVDDDGRPFSRGTRGDDEALEGVRFANMRPDIEELA